MANNANDPIAAPLERVSMLAEFRKDWAVLPNLVTELRGFLSPFAGVMIVLNPTAWLVPAVLFAAAALTDKLDGWLAGPKTPSKILGLRSVRTIWGKTLDPVVDKFLAVITLGGLSVANTSDYWVLTFTAVVTIREVAVAVLVWAFRRMGVELPVKKGGKVKTVFQGIAIAGIFPPLTGVWLMAEHVLMGVAIVLTITSGYDYFKRAFQVTQ